MQRRGGRVRAALPGRAPAAGGQTCDGAGGEPAIEQAVLLCSPEYPPDRGGVADFTANLAHTLTAKGLCVQVAVITPRPSAQDPDPDRTVWRYRRSPAALARLLRISRQRFSVVHLQYVPQGYARHGVALELILFALALRLATGTRLVTTMHELWIPWERNPVRVLVGIAQRLQTLSLAVLSHRVIVTTRLNGRRLTSALPFLKLYPLQIPVGSNVPVVASSSSRSEAMLRALPAGSPILATFNPLTVGRGFLPLLDVLGAVPEAFLLCIGGLADAVNAREAGARNAAAARTLASRVVWTEYLPSPEVSWLLQRTTVYLHLQDTGASFRSTSLAAALEHGLPIVAYRGAETEGEFIHGNNIFLIDPGEQGELERSVALLLGDSDLCRRLGAGAWALWEHRCSWQSIATATIACYRAVLPRAGRLPDDAVQARRQEQSSEEGAIYPASSAAGETETSCAGRQQ